MDAATLRRLLTVGPGDAEGLRQKALKTLSGNDTTNDDNDLDNSPQMRHVYLSSGGGVFDRAFRDGRANSRGDDERLRKVVPGNGKRVPTESGQDDYVERPLMPIRDWNQGVEENAMTLDETPYHIGDGQWSKEDLRRMATHPSAFWQDPEIMRHADTDFPRTEQPAWKRY